MSPADQIETMNANDETNITDIDLLSDGRICVFGTSIEVLEILDQLQSGADSAIRERLDSLHGMEEAEEPHHDSVAAAKACDG
jgi:hypothetical protein